MGANKPPRDTRERGFAVLLGDGDGTFTKSESRVLSTNPAGFSFGDFNGDGKEDFVYVEVSGTQAFVALGDGTGKFHQLPSIGIFNTPTDTAMGDFNRDGKLDMVVTDRNGLYLLLGNGDGTFQPQQEIFSFFEPYALTPADFNGDGILDLAFYNSGTGLAAVLLGNGDGSFRSPIETQQGSIPMLLGDFNGDGKLDFAVLGAGIPWQLGILLGNGDGTFQAPQFFSTGFMNIAPFCMLGDFNSDGKTDLFSYSPTGFLAGFLAGNGDGTFQPVVRITLPGPMSKGLPVVGDFNSDGLMDFVIAVGGAEVFLQAPQ